MSRILVADDEKNIRSSLTTTFRLDGYRVEAVADGQSALDAIEGGGFDLALLDLQMPRLDGLETLRRLRSAGQDLPVIFLTAHGTIERAVEAVRLGAFDFIEKPPHSEKILLAVRNALRQRALEDENRELRDESDRAFEMIGATPPMEALFEKIRRAAPTEARILILGENGTGKELIARAVHSGSTRRGGPFVSVNCAAIPRDLFESELFGHEKGAFTGATGRRRGKFVRADHGTLFLDEVAEIPLDLQSKLLRALESGEIEPVGADGERQVDVRVIAATNKQLEQAVAAGEFRADLYYRLQVLTLEAPPLRLRKGDLDALVERFLRQACADNHLPTKTVTPAALERLQAHDYPGNVRELRNVVERLVILVPEETIDADDVEQALPAPAPAAEGGVTRGKLREAVAGFERQLILQVLEARGWLMSAAAAELGLERSHLYKKLKALGIERPGS